ncbi:MAG: hypothetical protein QHH30_01000 [candidate division NC10 bacterium]|nr:hypothetical protein [candidate division NC10 bacterium]
MKPSKDLGPSWHFWWRGGFLLLLSLFLCCACATKRYEGPFSGRSADSQLATSAALDKVISSTSLSALAGKRVSIEAFSLTERIGDQGSPEELLLRAWFSEKLRREGAQVVERPEEAEVFLSIMARAIGVDVVRRDFPFIIYIESTRGRVNLHLVAFDTGGQILFTQDRQEKVTFREIYLIYLIGPFTWIR